MRWLGQDGAIARLLLLNGPPGVGKSTIAQRYINVHPLTLLIEIDGLRAAIGGWAAHEASKLQARALAVALARAHLSAGHDVVIPQYVGRVEFVDQLEAVALDVGAAFKHVVLADDRHAVAHRFRARRRELVAAGAAHPQAEVADDEVDAAIADAEHRLADLVSCRSDVTVVQVSAAGPHERVIAALS